MSLKQYIPALKFGHKLGPDEIAGIVGLPYVGNVFYIDPTAGNDTHGGQSFNKAYATVKGALEAELGTAGASTGNHDVFLIAPSGGTGRTAETGAITWNYRFTHLVGSVAPLVQDNRAGINFGASASLSVTQNGCLFKGLTLTGTEDVNVPVTVNGGDYNSFVGVDFKGSLNDTTGDDTAARALYLTGAQENFFGGCSFGADTFLRSAANATVEFASASSRNVFDDCRFFEATDATTPVHILFTGTSAIDRWLEFKDCLFYNFTANDAAEPVAVMDLSAQTATGHVLLTGVCNLHHIDNWEATASGRISASAWTATTNAVGKMINPVVD